MPIVQQGNVNTTSLVVPNLYVQIVPPQNLVLNGVPTNVIGVVGTAQWGALNKPTVVSNGADYALNFGAVQNRPYDAGTQVATAIQQGASNFRVVRVSDGTDVAAFAYLVGNVSNGVTLTAKYTGTLGNSLNATLATGSAASTWRLTVSLPGRNPEVFDNIAGSGATFWTNLAAAVNNGTGVLRGASQLVAATVNGAYSTAPSAIASTTFTSGTDGVATITSSVLIGSDTTRTGMYALRAQGISIGVIANADDTYASNYATWTTQAAFGLSEGIYMIVAGASGDTISTAVTNKATAGLDSYAVKLMFGDWLYWNDPVNGVLRLVSPQGFVAGRLANLSPEQSSLNKPLYSIVGSQKTGTPGTAQDLNYSDAELQTLFQAGIDVVTNPVPGGHYWGVRLGHNSSSSAAVNGDNYTRMTNYIAATLAAGMGQYVGQVVNSKLFQRIRATLLSFLQNMLGQGLLGSTDGSLPFSVICDTSNNPDSRTSLGYVQADAQIKYQAINEKFIVNVEGGQTVVVNKQTTPSGQSS